MKQRFEPVVLSEYTRNPIPFVISGQLDFAVVTSTGEPSLHYVKLFEDELVAICSVRHAWSSAKTLKAHDFINENFFEYNTDGKNLDAHKLFFDKAFTRPRWTTKIDLTEAIIQLVKANMGVAILAKWAVQPYLNDKQLKSIRLTTNGVFRRWHLCYRNNLSQGKAKLIGGLAPKLRMFFKETYAT